jgi:glycosyltransferase involved in cell wall biosynthesis
MHVHVHLSHGFGERSWNKRFVEGTLIGINEPDAYGYRQAEGMGVTLSASEDHAENRIVRTGRLGLRWFLGFDLVHAARNRAALLQSDVIWTHTESQFLGILALFALLRLPASRRPKIIAQSVWMIDDWTRQPFPRRLLWRKLIGRADVLTFHSTENLRTAKRLFPDKRSELVLFGIRAAIVPRGARAAGAAPVRLIAVGNDRRRDWATLIAAVRALPDCTLRIVSTTCPSKLALGVDNVTISGVSSNDDLMALYREADLAIVPVTENLQASGITAVQEAVLCGVPVIASDTGGLRAYFDADCVCYVPPGQPHALSEAISALLHDPQRRAALVERSQARMGPHGLGSEAFVRRHVELSAELLGEAVPQPSASVVS